MMKTNMMNGTVERRRRWARGALASALAATLALFGCVGGTYGDNAAEGVGAAGEGGAAANTETVDWDALIDIFRARVRPLRAMAPRRTAPR